MKLKTILITICIVAFSTNVFSQMSLFKKPFNLIYEAGYSIQFRRGVSYSDLNLPGMRTGLSGRLMVTPKFSLQLGAVYTFSHYFDEQYYSGITQRSVLAYSHQLDVPIYAGYTVPLFGKIKFFAYAGPDFRFGLSEKRLVELSDGFTSDSTLVSYLQDKGTYLDEGSSNLYKEKELRRVSLSLGVGGGFTWKRFLLKSGYDFGLTNINAVNDNRLTQSGWYISLGYSF